VAVLLSAWFLIHNSDERDKPASPNSGASWCFFFLTPPLFKRLASGYSQSEKRALFSGTAARVYRLTLE
jgi:hypothetical protein